MKIKEPEIVTCEELYNKVKDKGDFPDLRIVLKCNECGRSD
jgi:hypothetical protein